MEKMTFREAQLCVLGSLPEYCDKSKGVELNNLQIFAIGEGINVIEICLDKPFVVVRISDGPEAYLPIMSLAEWVIIECVRILREVAAYYDSAR